MSDSLRKRDYFNADKNKKKIFCHKETLSYSDYETPDWLREPFIRSGYREAYSTVRQCLQSLCYLHNETFNIWSHVVVSLYFIVRFGMLLFYSRAPLDPSYLPLASSALGTIIMYSTSASAHLFNCISERTYKTSFFLDHAAISLYTFTSSQAMFFYTRPLNSEWFIFQSPYWYLSVAALLSCLATYSCCKTIASYNKFSGLFRTLLYLAAWLNTAFPFVASLSFCTCHATSTCVSFPACSTSLSIGYYLGHVVCTISLGLVYSSKLPERIFPGRFDLFGNSHHFLHIASALGTEFALRVIELSITRATQTNQPEALVDVSLCNTLGLTLLVLVVDALIAISFGYSAPVN